jgi:5-formyltetrahydrofolate cyclo-ligase
MQTGSKEDLRARMKRWMKKLPFSLLHDEGAAAARLLGETFCWSRYETILLFLSTSHEIDTMPLFEAVLEGGKKAFVPVIAGGSLEFCRVPSAAGPWKAGPLGIREPAVQAGLLQPEDFPALVIVPGLAFDQAGSRLGYGKAYYDRFFAGQPGPCFKIGLCTGAQILPCLPADPWDVPMDALCTGSRFIPISGREGILYQR